MSFCGKCGFELGEGLRFCPQCGATIPVHLEDAPHVQDDPKAEPPTPKGTEVAVPIFAKEATAAARQAAASLAMRDVEAPAAVGEAVLSSWQGDATGTPLSAEQLARMATAAAQASTATTQAGKDAQPSEDAQAKRKKSKLPRIVGAAAVLVVVVIMALYVIPLFIPHPVDPHEHESYTPFSSSQSAASTSGSTSASTSTTSSAASSSTSSTSTSSSSPVTSTSTSAKSATSASTSTSTSSGTATDTSSKQSAGTSSAGSATSEKSNAATSASSSPKSSGATSASANSSPTSFSTDKRPVLTEFKWLTGDAAKGNVPSGAKRITAFNDVVGGWKAYIYGSGMEWLLNATIDAGQSGATVSLDWYYLRDNSDGSTREDTTPNSSFTGSWTDNSLDATGSGRITIVAFWQQGTHQYATGSFIWPDGGVCSIALVRP